jgi:hypothetical protein
LYLNSYLTTIPTSAHTSVFILFLRVKPPLGLALLQRCSPQAGRAFYTDDEGAQAFFLKNPRIIFHAFNNCLPRKRIAVLQALFYPKITLKN